jgi:hypothetical protein
LSDLTAADRAKKREFFTLYELVEQMGVEPTASALRTRGRGQKTSITYANNGVTTLTYFDQLADARKNFRVKHRTTSNGLQDLQRERNESKDRKTLRGA